ncbi:MAG TPA: ABC transporter permease [Candidatus Acidoferrales bacterium]|nr:ABC transporter permease [Candidatus Acidoferrales bacterium]
MNFLDYLLAHPREVLTLTLEHLSLAGISVGIAVLVGVPLGVTIARRPAIANAVLGLVNSIHVVPSLALFGFLFAVPWIGERAPRMAILALSLYALLPILRNVCAGILGVDPAVVEAGRGLGLTDRQLLLRVELPLALGVIVAGVRVAAVLAIGITTIAAAIGAGGLGELIFRGLAMVNTSLIFAGALPAAVLALAADLSLGWIEARLRERV